MGHLHCRRPGRNAAKDALVVVAQAFIVASATLERQGVTRS